MGLPKPKKEIGCLAAIIFVIMGFATQEFSYFIAAIVWGLIVSIFED